MEYLKDYHGGGSTVNDIWSNSLRNTDPLRSQETPFTALMRNEGWSVDQFNDVVGDWAMHNVTWDYSNGAVYRSSYGSYDNRTQHKRNRVTMLERTDSINNRYVSPDYWSPQALGYNLLGQPLYQSSIEDKQWGFLYTGLPEGVYLLKFKE